ncbi:alpha/beta hydrolase family protein [Demequina oxidasica]|uniref:alpha/beta hydrolase family protein n=1 Tax=Demequina oxidasica TaxID=676199 RepID=UPI0007839309|nr:dienelactone hydrolase family protein [Demequina oxidasica]
MKTNMVKRNSFWLILSLVLVLISAVGASLVQTNGGKVAIKDMQWETSSGRMLNALLFKPENATVENPAPAVVVSHGWWNNREMQDANYVELARRGYVVISIDMYGHGNSDPLPADEIPVGGTGMYDAVKLMADLPYVDATRIGVSGHSNGARAANFSVAIDNEMPTPLIASVFLVDNEAFYNDAANDNAYYNMYGSRDVGLNADQYDEFFFRSYSAEGEVLTPPREFATTDNAQSFLHFGAAPGTYDDVREIDTYYTENIDGVDAVRILHTPAETHPWGTISAETVSNQIDFFDTTLGAPNEEVGTGQVWQVKEFFTTLGVIGFGIFLVAFTRMMLQTRAFSSLKIKEKMAIAPANRIGKVWFWGGLLISAVFSGWSYLWLSKQTSLSGVVFNSEPSFFVEGAVFFIALWAAINGVFAAIVMTLSYLFNVRKQGKTLRDIGVLPGWASFGKGIGLAAIVVSASFSLVFFVDYFFKTDFRLWVFAIKVFPPDKIGYALLVLPLFLIYFVANSVIVNSFSRISIGGKEWVNTALLAFFNALGPLVLVIWQYSTFFNTGHLVDGFGGIFSIWLFPTLIMLPAAAVISRKIYRETNNPYIAGFINATAVALIAASNSLVTTF